MGKKFVGSILYKLLKIYTTNNHISLKPSSIIICKHNDKSSAGKDVVVAEKKKRNDFLMITSTTDQSRHWFQLRVSSVRRLRDGFPTTFWWIHQFSQQIFHSMWKMWVCSVNSLGDRDSLSVCYTNYIIHILGDIAYYK